MKRRHLYILLLSWFLCGQSGVAAQDHPVPGALCNKQEITLVVTDSGLGGVAVMEDVSRKMKESRCFRKVNLVFVNALFDKETGYNALRTKREKTEMFDRVLAAISSRYNPDAILIGCNTLSVLFDETSFSRSSETPVIGIVDAGITLIADKLKADSTSRVIIFGTETTIEENSHNSGLLELGVAGERIVTKACPQLQSYIEQDPASEETEMLISVYMNEALEKLDENGGDVYISLNCSHFGYSEELWRKAIRETGYRYGGTLNPNSSMGDALTRERCRRSYNNTKISFLVVSGVVMPNAVTIAGYFRENSPEIADALKNYTLIPELFQADGL
jgi:glutamate racemase